YLVATALCKGRLTLDDLEEAALRDPAVLGLCALTDYRHDPDSDFPLHYGGEVIVELQDGRTLREREAVNRGAEDRPLGADDIRAKFHDNARRQVSAERAAAIEACVLGLEQVSARALAQGLTHPCARYSHVDRYAMIFRMIRIHLPISGACFDRALLKIGKSPHLIKRNKVSA